MSHKHREIVYPEGFHGVFDTHAHLYDHKYSDADIDAGSVLKRSASCGIDTILIPADNVETSRLAIDFVKQWDGYEGIDLYCSVGVHPHEASSYDDEAERFIIDSVNKRDELKVMAIGEIGLDYYYDLSPRDVQRDVFRRQLELCHELDIPFIMHERDATQDCINILKQAKQDGVLLDTPGVCHCCTCSAEIAEELIKLGFFIGFDGPLTFKNNKKTIRTLEVCPLDRIVVETDSPYLTPEPNRGRINESSFVPFVLKKVAEVKNISEDEVTRITRDNGMRLFRIGEK